MKNIFIGMLGIFLGAFSCYAQSTTSLRGVITDPTGGVVAHAKINLASTENGFVRRNVTDANGAYSFLQIAPGTYKLTIEKTGFATMTRSDVKLLVNTPSTFDLTMKVSTISETVNVTAEVSQVNTTDASIGNPFSEEQVREIPRKTRNVVA